MELEKLNNDDYIIENGESDDIDELENLYDDLNDYLRRGENYPGWAKGVYPIRKNEKLYDSRK